MIEVQNVVDHLLGFHGWRLGVELDGFQVAVDGVFPVALLAIFVTFLIPFLGSHGLHYL